MASDPGISHADLQTPELHEKKKKPCFRIVGIRPLCGRQTLVRPMQTCRHPNKLHDKKDKPVHHGFYNEEAYPLWHQTLVHPTQICRQPSKLHEKKEKPCFRPVGVRPWYTPHRPTDTQRNCMRGRKNLCIMASTTKKHIHHFKIMGTRPWYTPRRPVDIQTNHQRGWGNQCRMVSTTDYSYEY